jgi:hypothetical protein
MERSITGSCTWWGKRSASTNVVSAHVGSLDQAARKGEWPFPEATVLGALRGGYDPVPRTARRLLFV